MAKPAAEAAAFQKAFEGTGVESTVLGEDEMAARGRGALVGGGQAPRRQSQLRASR